MVFRRNKKENMKVFTGPSIDKVSALLMASDLPVADLDELTSSDFLFCGNADCPAGVIGLQVVGVDALVRSLVVSKKFRGQGNGKKLVAAIEAIAPSKGVQNLYLLTETAEPFFTRLGYRLIDRNNAPDAIKKTPSSVYFALIVLH